MVLSSLMANTGGYPRLVRCPKCLNILPEPPNVAVYCCGGCGITLRVKIRTGNGQHVATKQVRQDSDNYSVATAMSNGAPSQTKEHASTEITMDSTFTADAPSTKHGSNNGARSNQSADVVLPGKNDVEVENNESKDHLNFEGQDTDSRMDGLADLVNSNANSTCRDSGEADSHIMEQPAENSLNSETGRVTEDDAECHLDASENNMLPSDISKADVGMENAEQKEAGEAEHTAIKKSYLERVLSRSCDLRASGNSIDFHSARTSLQSKSFRASEPLQSKIMNTVDELKGDLSELFHKPAETKPKGYPPRPSKQDGHMTRAAITSSAPLAAYHPAAKHSGYAARLSRSGQVAPRGLPSLRYRRHRVYPCHHNVQMEMRPCRRAATAASHPVTDPANKNLQQCNYSHRPRRSGAAPRPGTTAGRSSAAPRSSSAPTAPVSSSCPPTSPSRAEGHACCSAAPALRSSPTTTGTPAGRSRCRRSAARSPARTGTRRTTSLLPPPPPPMTIATPPASSKETRCPTPRSTASRSA